MPVLKNSFTDWKPMPKSTKAPGLRFWNAQKLSKQRPCFWKIRLNSNNTGRRGRLPLFPWAFCSFIYLYTGLVSKFKKNVLRPKIHFRSLNLRHFCFSTQTNAMYDLGAQKWIGIEMLFFWNFQIFGFGNFEASKWFFWSHKFSPYIFCARSYIFYKKIVR